MIPSVTYHPIPTAYAIEIPSSPIILDPNFESLTFSEKLKSIGLFDKNFNLLFTPSEIPCISERGQSRWNQLLEKNVHCCTAEGETIISLKQSEYISGFASVLSEKGIKIQSYLRGGYAAYVACVSDYLEHLILEFLASKNLPKDLFSKELEALKNLDEEAPHDVDLFDHVLNDRIPPTALCDYHIEFLTRATKNGNYKKIKNQGFIQLLIPKVSPAFPYPEDYVLFTIGDRREKFQTDRIIGRLHHEYLYVRDDIRIEINDNKISTPESSGIFWQMVIDRELKIARTEFWHKKDFRAGLAALQLIQDDHFLIEDNCTLQSILQYALSTGSDYIFYAAIERARLHSKKPFGFLLSILIAYSHTAKKMNREIPHEHLEILNKAILGTGNEILPLTSLYNLALLLTLYKDNTKTYRAEWDTAGIGLLTLYVDENRIIFPKNFSIKGTNEKSLISPLFSSWIMTSSCYVDPVYEILENNLSYLERVLFELALQKPSTPLTESVKEALIEYLIHTDIPEEQIALSKVLHPWLHAAPHKVGWIKALLNYSFKHGLKLWNASKTKMKEPEKLAAFEEIIHLIALERPNSAYVLLEEETIPNELRLKLLKKIIQNTSLSLQHAVKTIDELIGGQSIETGMEAFLIRTIERLPSKEGYLLWKKLEPFISLSPKLLQIVDRLISSGNNLLQEDEEWFFNSNPSKTRIEALYRNWKGDAEILLKWVMWKSSSDIKEAVTVFQNHKNECKALPEKYIKSIKQIQQIADKDIAVLMQSLAKEWIESFPILERMDQALLFFDQYTPDDYPLLEIICSLNGLSEQKLLMSLHQKNLPVFANRSFSNLLNFLNYDFPIATKIDILKTLTLLPLNDKELKLLQRWMKANPPLSLHLISFLFEKENTAFLPFALNHLISLKNTKNASSNDVLFAPLWLKILNLSLENPETLQDLTPFYKNRSWLKSVYGTAMATKTKEWAKALIKHKKLNESEKVLIKDMLSRTKLINSPLVQLKYFLESIYSDQLVEDDMLRPYFHAMVSSFLLSIQVENEERRHNFEILFKLLKLGMASKLHSTNGFNLMEQTFAFVPILVFEKGSFDPLFHLLQTLPLVDYGSSELYNQWNDKRNELHQRWQEVVISEGFCIKDIKGSKSLKILPYEQLLASLEFSHLFKLITEQYIENKVTKEEFQLEVRELSISARLKFKSQELISHEDPCLICINDLSFFLKNKIKRVRAYEAFHYLLNQQIDKMEAVPQFIDEQMKYLEIRRTIEDIIISATTSLVKSKGIYSNSLCPIHLYLNTLCKSYTFQNLHTQDPILDAFELEMIHPMYKVDLLKLWTSELELITTPYYFYHAKRVRSLLEFEKKKLNEQEVITFIQQRIELLKLAKGFSDTDKYSEGIMIFQSASLYLPQDIVDKIHVLIEEALNVKIPIMVYHLKDTEDSSKNSEKKSTPTNLLIKAYIESICNEKVTDENLSFFFHSLTISLVNSIVQEETLQYYSFNTVLKLVNMGIASGFITSNCFALMGLMLIKAPQFLLVIENKVVFDPYVELLQSLSLTDMGSLDHTNELNRQKEDFFQFWIQTLESSENQNIVSYAKEYRIIESLPYETLKTSLNHSKEFKLGIEKFINQEVTAEEFKEGIERLSFLASNNIQADALNKHNDPCLNALKELSFLLKNKEKRIRAYAAFNYLCEQWTKNVRLQLPYIGQYRSYLSFRRATEDLLLDQVDLLKKNKTVYCNFYQSMTSHLRSLHGSYILQNIHIYDPILEALNVETLSLIDKIELLKHWGKVLKESKNPLAQYQSEMISNYIKFESTKIKEKDVEIFLGERVTQLKKAKPKLDNGTFAREIEIIFRTASVHLPPEKAQEVLNNMNAMLSITVPLTSMKK